MAYTPIYTPKNFSDWGPPDLDASNLNDIEAALVSLGNGLQTAAADTDTNTANIATINGEISDINDLIAEMLPVDSESGNPAVITDAFGGAAKSLILTLEPIQSGSGTPSPQNVRPISGRTSATVKRIGKNILKMTVDNIKTLNTTGTWNGNIYTINGMTFTLIADTDGIVTEIKTSGIPSATVSFMVDTFPGFDASVAINGCPSGGGTLSKYKVDLIDRYAGVMIDTGAGSSATITATETYRARIVIYTDNTAQSLSFKPMLRYAAFTDATFEPYKGEETYTIDLNGTRYGGTVDFKTGLMTLTKELKPLIVGAVGPSASGTRYADCQYSGGYNTPAISNMYTQINTSATGYNGMFKVYNIAITMYDDRFTDVATAQSILNDCQVVIDLATPITVQLTPGEVTLLKGNNVITTDADNVDVEYSADIKLYIDKRLGTSSSDTRSTKSSGTSEEETKTVEEKTVENEEAQK